MTHGLLAAVRDSLFFSKISPHFAQYGQCATFFVNSWTPVRLDPLEAKNFSFSSCVRVLYIHQLTPSTPIVSLGVPVSNDYQRTFRLTVP